MDADQQTMLRLFALERYKNSEIDNIVQGIRYGTDISSVFSELFALRTCSNSEIAGILKTFRDVLVKASERNSVSKHALEMLADKILDMKFAKSDKDVEIVLLVYFDIILLLKELEVKDPGEDVFYKFYFACADNSIRRSVREMIYMLFERLLEDSRFMSVFLSGRCYVKFPFLHELVSKFGCFLENEQAAELCFYLVANCEVHLASMLIAFSRSIYILSYCLFTVGDLSFLRQSPAFYNVAFLYQNIDKHFLLESNISDKYFNQNFGAALIQDAIDFVSTGRNKEGTCVFCAERRHFEKLKKAIDDINNLSRLDDFDSLAFRFVRYSRQTNLVNLGCFLSKEKNADAMETFLDTFNFGSLDPLEALRLFLSSFILPGESQIIYRIIERFNEKYCRDQADLDRYFEKHAKADGPVSVSSFGKQSKIHLEKGGNTSQATGLDSEIQHIVEDLPPYTENASRDADDNMHRHEIRHADAEVEDTTIDGSCIFVGQETKPVCVSNLVQEYHAAQNTSTSSIRKRGCSNPKKDAMFIFVYALVALNTQLHNPAAHIRPSFSQFAESLKPQKLCPALLSASYASIKNVPLRYAKCNEFSIEHYRIFSSLCADLQLPVKYETNICYSCFAEAYREVILRNYMQVPRNSTSLLCDLCIMLGLEEVVYNIVLCLGEDVLETSGLDRRKIMLFFEVFTKHCNSIGDLVPNCGKGLMNSDAVGTGTLGEQEVHRRCNSDEDVFKASTNPFILPFMVFNRILDFKTSEKYTIMKVIRGSSYKKVLLNYESIYLGFIKSTEKLSNSNFVKMVRCTKDSRLRSSFVLDIFFDITLENCHRVNLCDLSEFDEENLSILAERSVELGLKEHFKFITQFMCTESLFSFLESSLKKNKEFYTDNDVLSFVLGFAEKVQNMDSFNLIVALQTIQDVFDFVVKVSSSEIVCTFSYGDDNIVSVQSLVEDGNNPPQSNGPEKSSSSKSATFSSAAIALCPDAEEEHKARGSHLGSCSQHISRSLEPHKVDLHYSENDGDAKVERESTESAHLDSNCAASLSTEGLHGARDDRFVKRRDVFMAYSIEEKFKDILCQKASFLKFVMSSPSIINTNVLSRFFRTSPGTCILDSEISRNIDNKLIYLFMKADFFGDEEVLKYSLWIFNLCSASLPLISGFLGRNFGLLLQLRNKTLLLSISKILVSRMKKVINGEPVCMESCKHSSTMKSSMDIVRAMHDYDVSDPSIFTCLDDVLQKYRDSTADVFDV